MLDRYKSYQDYQKRAVIILGCFLGLVLVYLFQHFNYAYHLLGIFENENVVFIVNKSTRLILNDTLCLGLIYGFFYDEKYVKVGSIVQLVEIFLLLPIYFYFKLALEGTSEISSPLLSQIHRLIVNPTMMVLLMIGFYYQRRNRQET